MAQKCYVLPEKLATPTLVLSAVVFVRAWDMSCFSCVLSSAFSAGKNLDAISLFFGLLTQLYKRVR